VSVLFADIVGFTPLSERLSAGEFVAVLDSVFASEDRLATRYGVEKIKTIGDAYMVVGGIPEPYEDHGRAKFIYDLWGDTVNTASRMESHALPGTIQVTARTYDRLRGRYELRPRGTIEVKGKGPMNPYLLIRPRDKLGTAEPPASRQLAAIPIPL
jgi:guanylate cyclase